MGVEEEGCREGLFTEEGSYGKGGRDMKNGESVVNCFFSRLCWATHYQKEPQAWSSMCRTSSARILENGSVWLWRE